MLSSSIAEAESYSAVATKCTAVTPEPDDGHQRWRRSQSSKSFVWIACSKSDSVRLGLHHGCPSSMILFTFLLSTDDVVRQWPPVCSRVVCNGWNGWDENQHLQAWHLSWKRMGCSLCVRDKLLPQVRGIKYLKVLFTSRWRVRFTLLYRSIVVKWTAV